MHNLLHFSCLYSCLCDKRKKRSQYETKKLFAQIDQIYGFTKYVSFNGITLKTAHFLIIVAIYRSTSGVKNNFNSIIQFQHIYNRCTSVIICSRLFQFILTWKSIQYLVYPILKLNPFLYLIRNCWSCLFTSVRWDTHASFLARLRTPSGDGKQRQRRGGSLEGPWL